MNAVRIRKRLTAPIAELPELTPLVGRDIEIIAMEESPLSSLPTPPPIASFEELRSKLPDDPLGSDFESTLQNWRGEPWRSGPLPEDK